MSSEKHKGRGREKEFAFCAWAPNGGECACGNDYKFHGKAPAGWNVAGVAFTSSSKKKAFKYFEAHHVLSVGPVSSILFDDKAVSIRAIVDATVWCVNNEGNMVSMPSMAHTINWYVSRKESNAPPFANIPQHDWDHHGYIHELKKKLKSLVKAVVKKAKIHETKPENIRADMLKLTTYFRGNLTARGLREGGTHVAYSKTLCAPFSMASNDWITDRTFPSGRFGYKFEAWKKRIMSEVKAK